MRKLFSSLAVPTILLAICGIATAVNLGGVVWFDWMVDEAPCAEVTAYANSDYTNPHGWDVTDSCGIYTIIGLLGNNWYYVEVIFPKSGCTAGSWSGTCDSTAIRDSKYGRGKSGYTQRLGSFP